MASKFYGKKLPDYGDIDNETGKHNGFRVYVLENDGGIGIEVFDANNKENKNGYSVFLNIDDAKEFVESLNEAIKRAKAKKPKHPSRAVDC